MAIRIKDFATLCEQLQSTTGRIEKENYLKEHAENKFTRAILYFLYNPYVITGISKKKVAKLNHNVTREDVDPNYSIINLINYLRENNTGRDCDLDVVEQYAQANGPYVDLIYKIVSKNLKLGIQATTINKIFGKGFIPTFDVMLGFKYFDDPEKLLPKNTSFILTQKLDGVRCVCIKENGEAKFYSRQGQPIEDLVDIEQEAIEKLPDGYVYDGELLLTNDKKLSSKDLYRATVKVTSSDNIKKNIIFNVFDILNIESFKHGFCAHSSYSRKRFLHNFLTRKEFDWIKEVPILYSGTDQSQITYWLDKIVAEDGEGVMINLTESPYEAKRSKGLLKVKKMQTCDLRCIGIEEGTGQNEGKLGAILVDFIGPDNKHYVVKVGSGFTLEERDYYWIHRDEIIEKIVEVQYFEVSQNQQGGYSLRFPVFKYVREDKDEISMN